MDKDIGDSMARRTEIAFGLKRGWMEAIHCSCDEIRLILHYRMLHTHHQDMVSMLISDLMKKKSDNYPNNVVQLIANNRR